MKKEETLEDAINRISKENGYDIDGFKVADFVNGMIRGAKWQYEQDKNKYSKEDLKEAFKQSRQCKIFEKDMPPVHNTFEDWFNQFKKKA